MYLCIFVSYATPIIIFVIWFKWTSNSIMAKKYEKNKDGTSDCQSKT